MRCIHLFILALLFLASCRLESTEQTTLPLDQTVPISPDVDVTSPPLEEDIFQLPPEVDAAQEPDEWCPDGERQEDADGIIRTYSGPTQQQIHGQDVLACKIMGVDEGELLFIQYVDESKELSRTTLYADGEVDIISEEWMEDTKHCSVIVDTTGVPIDAEYCE